MTISAVALFGSHARGDAEPGSDVDILGITFEQRTRHVEMGNVSLYLYPWIHLLDAARRGDLFLCHIVSEAKPLHDPEARLEHLGGAFVFKESYADEIRKASDLGWYLATCREALTAPSVAKRIAWCVRTVVIARSAEQHMPCFAASALAKFSGSGAVRELILRKDDERVEIDSPELLREFLIEFGTPEPFRNGSTSAYRSYFEKSENDVALQTMRGQSNFRYASLRES